MPSNSFHEFEALLASVDQLINIHRKLQQGRGRRHEQDAIHRAGVVLTVAAWQAYVEKVLNEGLQYIQDSIVAPVGGVAPPSWATSAFSVRKAAIRQRIGDFNTPNADNVRRLFKDALDFDPRPSWNWYVSRRHWDSAAFCQRTNSWLKIRHTIAHGDDLPPDIDWIRGSNGRARLTLSLLAECRKHFHYLANKTDQAFSADICNKYGLAAPW